MKAKRFNVREPWYAKGLAKSKRKTYKLYMTSFFLDKCPCSKTSVLVFEFLNKDTCQGKTCQGQYLLG